MKPTPDAEKLARELVTAWNRDNGVTGLKSNELQTLVFAIASQLTQYGNACAEAEREACAKAVERVPSHYAGTDYGAIQEAVRKIRARSRKGVE